MNFEWTKDVFPSVEGESEVVELGHALLRQFSNTVSHRADASARAGFEAWIDCVRGHNDDVRGYIISRLNDPESAENLRWNALIGRFSFSLVFHTLFLGFFLALPRNCARIMSALEVLVGPDQGLGLICIDEVVNYVYFFMISMYMVNLYTNWTDNAQAVERIISEALLKLRATEGEELSKFSLQHPAFTQSEVRWNVGPINGKYITTILARSDLQTVFDHATKVGQFTEEVATSVPLTKGTPGADNYQAYVYKNHQKLGIISRVRTEQNVYYITPAHVALEMENSVVQRHDAKAVVFDQPDYVVEDMDVAIWVENQETRDKASVLGWKAINVGVPRSRVEFQGYLPRSDGLWLGKSKLVPYKKWWGIWDHQVSTDKGDSGLLLISPPGRQASQAVAMHIGGQQLAEVNGAVSVHYVVKLVEFTRDGFIEESSTVTYDSENLRPMGDFDDFSKDVDDFYSQFDSKERKLAKKLAERDVDHYHTLASKEGMAFLAVSRVNKSVKRVKTTLTKKENEEVDRLIDDSLLRSKAKSRHKARAASAKDLIRKLPETIRHMPVSFVTAYNADKNKSILDYTEDPLFTEVSKEWKDVMHSFNPDTNSFRWKEKSVKYDEPFDRDVMKKGPVETVDASEDIFGLDDQASVLGDTDVDAFVLEMGVVREGKEKDTKSTQEEPKLPDDLTVEKPVKEVDPEKEILRQESQELMLVRALSLILAFDSAKEYKQMEEIKDSVKEANRSHCKSLLSLVDLKMGDLGTINGAFNQRRKFVEMCKTQGITEWHVISNDAIKLGRGYVAIMKVIKEKLAVTPEVAKEKLKEVNSDFKSIQSKLQGVTDSLSYCEQEVGKGNVNIMTAKLDAISKRLAEVREMLGKEFIEESGSNAHPQELLEQLNTLDGRLFALVTECDLRENDKAPAELKSRTVCEATSAGAVNSGSSSSNKGAGKKSRKKNSSGTSQSQE